MPVNTGATKKAIPLLNCSLSYFLYQAIILVLNYIMIFTLNQLENAVCKQVTVCKQINCLDHPLFCTSDEKSWKREAMWDLPRISYVMSVRPFVFVYCTYDICQRFVFGWYKYYLMSEKITMRIYALVSQFVFQT